MCSMTKEKIKKNKEKSHAKEKRTKKKEQSHCPLSELVANTPGLLTRISVTGTVCVAEGTSAFSAELGGY